MPTWHNADLSALLGAHTDVPVLIENDANLLALAESALPARSAADHLLAVKLGSRIGCGVITSGRLHRGVSGAAGEISHTPVEGESTISCVCGVPNCLESVASGGAIIELLRRSGYDISSTSDLVALARSGDPVVTSAIREAGSRIGAVLSAIVNFLNPREVVLGGTMSTSPQLVAAIRAELFQRCLPLVADDLEVRAVQDAATGGIRGAISLALDEALSPARINSAARAQEEEALPV
jgi:predicted NBD/HSP70 family sugar kinase